MAVSKTTDTNSFIAENDDFDVNDRPASASTQPEGMSSGWESASKLYTSPKLKYATELKLSERPQLVSFIDKDGPFANYLFHFLKQKTEGRRGFICNGRGCPLCTIVKDQPSKKTAFSVAVINDEGKAERQMLIAGSRLYQSLHAAHSAKGPLQGNFWEISKTGNTMQSTAYTVSRIKDRDLQEEYGLTPETAREDVSELEPFTFQDLNPLSDQELIDIIKEL